MATEEVDCRPAMDSEGSGQVGNGGAVSVGVDQLDNLWIGQATLTLDRSLRASRMRAISRR
jgi:hypothetical protein